MRVAWIGVVLCAGLALGQEAPTMGPPVAPSHPAGEEAPVVAPAQTDQAGSAVAPAETFDAAIYLKPMAKEQMEFVKQFDGAPSGELFKDKDFRKLLKLFVPDCMFHYGRDMPLRDALDAVISGSKVPVRIRDGRFVTVSGLGGTYLGGRGFLWIDLQTGIGLGGFYFHPTNGEPTPSLAVFSRQVKEDLMSYGALPVDFVVDMGQWGQESRVPFLLTNYFISGDNKRILLEHDEDYCSPTGRSEECEQMDADAADLDMTAAYYLKAVHYATNGTAWMIGPDQTAFLQVRERTCGGIADPLGCRIRVTRERVHVIQGRTTGVGRRR